MKFIDYLINSIRATADHNPEAEIRPYCILWTDKERQWESAIPRIIAEMQELLMLGDYNPTERKGPAIWLRAAIAECIEEYKLPYGRVPVLYLPGVSRQDLRAVEQCPEELKPLAELQYRGVIWSQVNARDWTIFAFMKTKNGGLGLEISQDDATLQAIHRAVARVLDEDIENLKSNHLDKDFFNSLISGVDIVKDILFWMCEPENFKRERTNEEWQAFVDICNSKYNLNPEQDGVLGAAEKIGLHEEVFNIIWNRFCEAPAKYKAIPDILRKTVMPLLGNKDRYPQWNEQKETSLRRELLQLSDIAELTAREEILRLETEHANRRNLVWVELGQSPLVVAMKWLAELAEKTSKQISGKLDEMAKEQEEWGWRADYAQIMALSSVEKQEDIEAVTSAIRAIYLPWIDMNARNLQKIIHDDGYNAENTALAYGKNECICFIDGLRFDLTKQLSVKLKEKGLKVIEKLAWTPLPSVTSTCKPALTPIGNKLTGHELQNQDFTPVLEENMQSATSQKMMNLMERENWKILSEENINNEGKMGWLEFGRIDDEGHSIGWRIVQHVESYINEAIEKIETLFKAGWKSVRIVSDHGWLLMPKGLPKLPLSQSLTDSKWGRCAAIKPGALYDGTYYPWYWNENVHFVLADGVSSYRNGTEYTHGGVSLQECLMLQLILSEDGEEQSEVNIVLTDIVWKGMRCKIAAEGNCSGLRADIRRKPGLAESSIVMNLKEFNENGITSVVIDDDSEEGKSAYIVILDNENKVVYQTPVVVGGES